MAHGHLIPTIDMAKLFASRGVKATIVTTPLNAPLVSRTVQRSKSFGFDINIKTIKFPAVEVGLPEGCENAESITSHESEGEMTKKFFQATAMLQEPLEKLLQECHPDCLIADMFLPWTTDAAAKFGIPRLVFHGISCFSLCTSDCLMRYKPFKEVSSDSELFVVPELPGEIKFTSKQLPDFMKQNVETEFTRLIQKVRESSWKSYGIVINSFYELESAYADFFKELGRKAWHIGPQWVTVSGDKMKSEAVEKAVTRIMIGEEAEEMRSRVEALGGMAKRAIEEDGSSYSNLNALIEELRGRRH
ncbi:hypothetical protein OIU76_020083 [Salix suchowensis]|nr:hypothetical protein OIU76_020083 [Salix suchowensis]